MDALRDNVERLGVRPVPPRAVPQAQEAPQIDLSAIQQMIEASQEKTLRAVQHIAQQVANQAVHAAAEGRHAGMVDIFRVISQILAVRFILLLAVIGGFALALIVLQSATVISACVLAGYVISTVWPLVWLDVGARKKEGNAG